MLLVFLCIPIIMHSQETTRGELLQLFHSAQKAQKENRIEDAINTYESITKKAPNLWEPYLALGVLYSVDGESQNLDLAMQFYNKYLELTPTTANDSIKQIIKMLESKAIEEEKESETTPEALSSEVDTDISQEKIDIFNEIQSFSNQSVVPDSKEETSDATIKEPSLDIKETLKTPISSGAICKDILKTFEGKWISNRFYASTMIPMWVFDIQIENDSLCIRMERGSHRYSSNLFPQYAIPTTLNDSTYSFNFNRPNVCQPSQSSSFIKYAITEVTNPRYYFLLGDKEQKLSEEQLEKFQKKTKELSESMLKAREQNTTLTGATFEEFTLERLSNEILKASCKEKISVTSGQKQDNENEFECYFYKIPSSAAFIMIGNSNTIITNRPRISGLSHQTLAEMATLYKKDTQKFAERYGKDTLVINAINDFDKLGYFKWMQKKKSVNTVSVIGKTILSTAMGLTGVFGMGFSNQLVNSLGQMLFKNSRESIENIADNYAEELKINPYDWNSKMYNVFYSKYFKADSKFQMKPVIDAQQAP